MLKLIGYLFPSTAVQLRQLVRREIKREVQQSLVSHTAARQALDLYEMKLETQDTRLAKRILKLEARIAELEGQQGGLRDRTGQEPPARDLSAREVAARDGSTRETASRDAATRELTPRPQRVA